MTPHARARAALLALALCLTGLLGATAATTSSDAAVDYTGYIAKAAEAAKASKKLYGVPRAVTIAQSILESGWGRSNLTVKYRNYFGIKCSAVISPHQKGCVSLPTYEYVKGKMVKVKSRFRVYSSMEKSFLDHGRLLNYADRYNAAFKYPDDPDQFIREVHKAGYATDPDYSKSVIALMRKWNLYRFDTVPQEDPNNLLIAAMADIAQRSEATTGVPSSVTIGQALLHSGSGRNTLATRARNYFGMICGTVKSTIAKGCLTLNGTRYRTYVSLGDSVKDHAVVLTTRPRYAAARKLTADPKAYLTAVAKAGWSSSSTYVSRVWALITKYRLTKYDLTITTTLRAGQRGAKVTALQRLLAAKGHDVTASGSYGAATIAAVEGFQSRSGLPETGHADPLTLTRLTPDVRAGAKGDVVAALHALLKARGLSVDGSAGYGSRTVAAVKAVQKQAGLPQSGIVSVRTWAVLFG